MKTKITLFLLTLFTTSLNAQTWSGTTPGNIYYNQGNVTIGASTSNAANLHLGKQEAPANSPGEVLRLSIQPYGHTGGPWIFKSRDVPGTAFLDVLYGTETSMTINSSGNIGIGTTSPGFRFHVRGGNPNSDLMQLGNTTTGNFALTSADGGAYGLFAGVSNTGKAWLQAGRYDTNIAYDFILQASGGNVLIGRTSQVNTAYKLDVNGAIRSNEVVVNTTGADFVFDKDYKLKDLEEVEKFIQANKHLPDIESAKEMEENGLALGKIDIKLLQKVEELTLYMIDFKKEMDQVKTENQKLRDKIIELEKD